MSAVRAGFFFAVVMGAQAQAPQADLSVRMQTISQALGVTCGYCHTAERGSGQPEPKEGHRSRHDGNDARHQCEN